VVKKTRPELHAWKEKNIFKKKTVEKFFGFFFRLIFFVLNSTAKFKHNTKKNMRAT